MTESYGLIKDRLHCTKIYLMTVDEFSVWLTKASRTQKAWVNAQGFSAKSGKAITFATNGGEIDFAVAIYGRHAVWDGASIADNLPIG